MTSLIICTGHQDGGGGWEDNIKMLLQEVECGGMESFKLAEDGDSWRALGTAVLNLRVP
jgi:hypothetical protein